METFKIAEVEEWHFYRPHALSDTQAIVSMNGNIPKYQIYNLIK